MKNNLKFFLLTLLLSTSVYAQLLGPVMPCIDCHPYDFCDFYSEDISYICEYDYGIE